MFHFLSVHCWYWIVKSAAGSFHSADFCISSTFQPANFCKAESLRRLAWFQNRAFPADIACSRRSSFVFTTMGGRMQGTFGNVSHTRGTAQEKQSTRSWCNTHIWRLTVELRADKEMRTMVHKVLLLVWCEHSFTPAHWLRLLLYESHPLINLDRFQPLLHLHLQGLFITWVYF